MIVKMKKLKRKNIKLIFIIIFIFIIGIIIGYTIFFNSYAFYEEKKDFNIINGTVEDPGDIYFSYYIDGEISREMPMQNTGYTLDTEKSNCNNGVIPSWDNAGWKFIGDYHNYSATDNTRTKCTLYFNKTSKTVSTALGNIEVNTYIPDFTKSACDDESCESHEKGIYETTDYDGNPTYYYRGSVENNYVKFAGFYWRIIRINSNGSIRMIYDGTSVHDNDEQSSDRGYTTVQFNSKYDDNMYVGYMYSSGEVHGTNTSSPIKIYNDKFYNDNLLLYVSKIDGSVGFCGDRTPINLAENVGIGTTITYYQGYLRLQISSPSLLCENMNDYYSTQSASKGNNALTYPIGLITIDEALLAGYAGGLSSGGVNTIPISKNNFLNMGLSFWSMTPLGGYNPYMRDWWYTYMGVISENYNLENRGTQGVYYLRPVINIRSDVTITGNGTMTDPYIIN